MAVNILTMGYWPTYTPVEINLPVEVSVDNTCSYYKFVLPKVVLLTVNLGQAFLFQVLQLIAIFVITFEILKTFVASLLRNIASLKTTYFLLEVIPILTLFLL